MENTFKNDFSENITNKLVNHLNILHCVKLKYGSLKIG